MDLIKHIVLFIFVFLGCSRSLVAQEKQPLVDVITHLETKYDVKFSYSVSEVRGVMVAEPKDTDTLKNIIATLNQTTLLDFQFLTDRYITIATVNKTIAVCGVLLSETHEPLGGATVVVANTSQGAITGVDGGFLLKNVPVNKKVIISFLGFKSQIISAKTLLREGDACRKLVMQAGSEVLNPVLISKYLTTGLQKQMDGSTVLNTEKFGILPGLTDPDVLQSIQALPGVESVNESTANINVRGGTNDQNLILWDDIKMYHSGHFFGLISAYNPYLTNKVVVTKNGTSSAFSDGVSSTISMFTKNEIEKEFSGGFGANLMHADAFLEIPISNKWAVHVSGRRSYTDFFSSPTYNNYFERSFQDSELTNNSDNINESNQSSEFFFYDYTAKLLFDLNEHHKFRAQVIGIHNNLDYTEKFINQNNETESRVSNLKQRNLGAGIDWNGDWGNRFSTTINAFYSKYNVDATDNNIETDQQLTQINEVLETGVKLKTVYRISDVSKVLSGYQFNEIGILNGTTVSAPAYSREKKDVLLNHALFSEFEFSKKNTYLRAGVRLNYFQKFNKLRVEPRLNVRQTLVQGLALKLQGEFKNQSATQIIDFQDDFLGVENRRWILANQESIPISESKQVSFGLEFNKNNVVLELEGFYKKVDGITVSNQGFYNNFQYLEAVGEYDVKGVEFLINKTAKNYSAWLSYTYSVNNYEFESLSPPVFPNNLDIRHSVSVACNYNILKSFKASLGAVWRTGKPYTKPLEGNETLTNGSTTYVNYDAPNSENLSDFMRLDASLSYGFLISKNTKALCRVGVINVLDRNNNINRYYEVNANDTNSATEVNNSSLGLTPNISFRVMF